MKTETKTETKPETKCNVNQVKPGDVYSRHSFGRIVDTGFDAVQGKTFKVQNTHGKTWEIGADLVGAEFCIAGQSDVDIALSRTKVLEILMKRTWTAMTVKFRKKVDLSEKETKAKLAGVLASNPTTEAVSRFMAGEERVMTGYHHGDIDPHGRLIFAEIVEGKEQRRLVDPRTVHEVIVANTRYVVDE